MLTTDHHLRFEAATGPLRHQALLGIDYSRVKLRSWGAYAEAAPIDIYAPVYGQIPEAALEAYPVAVDSQLGVYLQDQIRYGDGLTLVLGGRRDRATTEVEGSPAQIDKATTWRAGLIADVGAHLSPYLSYSESFQPTVGLDYYGKPFVPQRGRQVEAGVKWQPTPRTLLTLAAYDIKGSNRQTNDPLNGQNLIQQGEVSSRGVELEAAHAVRNDFSVFATYSHVNAKVSRSSEPLEVGLPLSAVPRDQASAWGEKVVRLGGEMTLRLGLGVRYVGPSVEAVVFDGAVERLRTPGFTLVDALVALERDAWRFALNVTNLADKHYYASCSVRSACGPGYLRNVAGTLGYQF